MPSCIDDDDMGSKGFGGLTSSSSSFSGDMGQKRWWFYNEIESGPVSCDFLKCWIILIDKL